jgi:uncharacterized membrane protein YkvA (DUF1232 family)
MSDFVKNKKHVDEEDLQEAQEKMQKVADKLDLKVFEILVDFMYMSWDYIKGNYPRLAVSSYLSISFAIFYFINPYDVVPDFIPALGYIDDAGIIGSVYNYVIDDVQAYQKWRKGEKVA